MIYISGKITGNPDFIKDFNNAELYLKSCNKKVINPVTVISCHKNYESFTWKQCMSYDIAELILCDEIFMLKNWKSSPGARIERKIAKMFGLKIIYQK